jgi:hypothetical protein
MVDRLIAGFSNGARSLPLQTMEEILEFNYSLRDVMEEAVDFFTDLARNSGVDFQQLHPMQIVVNSMFCRFAATAILDVKMFPAQARRIEQAMASYEADFDDDDDELGNVELLAIFEGLDAKILIFYACRRIDQLLDEVAKKLLNFFPPDQVSRMPR